MPQVSNRSRKSLEEGGGVGVSGLDAYSSGEQHSNTRDSRQMKISGLHQSPSVISLHDQSKHYHSREQIQISKKRSSKDSSVRVPGRGQSSDNDEYADEIQMITNASTAGGG